jgi:DNA-binding NarL/FixJ family response regulator
VSGPAITVVLVDDHPVVRAGMRAMLGLEDDITVVGEAASGEEALPLVAELRPTAVLMDLRMPGAGGVEATRRLRRHVPGVVVVVLTTYDTDADILSAVEAGAAGYLLKDTPPAQIAAALRAAAGGETVMGPTVAARLVASARAPATAALSPRERQVLTLVARGLANAEIGLALHITEATVKTHLLRSFAKLDVSDRTAAVTTAMGRGEIS